ncbi:MAG TPA: DUF5666 domain-containing protein, partial [Dehalococcoidia bacterium]|nr:DUF5666 domain-containing protein [Dehalococcoidia bacterium]
GGQPVKATAVRQGDGLLLARQIESRNEEVTPRRGQVKIIGTIEEVLPDGSLVIEGVRVGRGALTELEDVPQVGKLVVVEAILLENGALLAREVHLGQEVEVLGLSPVRESEIRGPVERVNADGSLVVNGVTVVVGSLTELEIDLTPGVLVNVEGVLQSDGSLLAREVRGESRGDRTGPSKFKITGRIAEVERDRDGNPEAVEVNGSRIALEALTRVEGPLEEGDNIEIRGILRDGIFLASQIEQRRGANRNSPEEFWLEGRVGSLWLNPRGQAVKLAINGLIVNILPGTKVKSVLEGGGLVQVNGVLQDGAVMAATVESREVRSAAARRSEFRLKAAVTGSRVDSQGRLRHLVVDGQIVTLEDETQIESGVGVGSIVEVEGVVNGDTYVAAKISLADRPSDRKDQRDDENRGRNGNREGGNGGSSGK